MPVAKKSRPVSRDSRIGKVRLLLHSGEGARALQKVGDRWCLLILRDAFLGVRRFEEFRRLNGAARGTLTARLNLLVEQGVLYRSPRGKPSSRLEYRLTDKGMAFYPVALTLWNWESRWADASALPPRLYHRTCGKNLHPQLVCARCDLPIVAHDVRFEPGPGARVYASDPPMERRRRETPASAADGVDTTMFHSTDTIGDRWSVLLLSTLFFGLNRYDDISAAMGIATNILADRLRRLLAAGVVEQHLYRDRPPRYEYRLTAKGWDLYPTSIAMHDWAATWVPSPYGPGMRLRHEPCGHTLRSRVACDQCRAPLDPHEVGLRASKQWRAARQPPKPAAARPAAAKPASTKPATSRRATPR